MHDFKEKIYIIAYVDFLGTKNAMSSDNSEKILECVKFLYDMIKQDKCDMHLNDCEVRTFSDNILLALPVDTNNNEEKLVKLIIALCRFQFLSLYRYQLLMRGSVSIGKMYIDDSIVWGEGLVNAYTKGDYEGKPPCISILSHKTEKGDNVLTYDNVSIRILPKVNTFIREVDDELIIDYLGNQAFYTVIAFNTVKVTNKSICDTITTSIKEQIDKYSEALAKWNWVKDNLPVERK